MFLGATFVRGFSIIAVALAVAFAALSTASAEEPKAEPKPEDLEFFEKRIRPVLVEHCFECHSTKAKKVQAGLKLDSRGGLNAGGDTGAVVVAAEPEKSLLVEAIKYDSERLQMPPDGKLPAQAIADLTEWVKRRAPYPPGEASGEERRGIDLVAGRKHWAFQPVRRIEPPSLAASQLAAWPQQRIDLFLAAAQAKHGSASLTAGQSGSAHSPRHVRSVGIAADARGDRGVRKRLIARSLRKAGRSPARLAPLWRALGPLLARPGPLLRRARIVARGIGPGLALSRLGRTRSLNEDLPYDEFVRRQLAADLLPGFEPRDSAALGFLGLSAHVLEGAEARPQRHQAGGGRGVGRANRRAWPARSSG